MTERAIPKVDELIQQPRVAFMSMEIALENALPTYAGGLGILAGDIVRTAADLELPMVAVSLVSRAGYFRQRLDEAGRQTEEPQRWEPDQFAVPLHAKVAVAIEGRTVWIGGWLYMVHGWTQGRQPVILLDTDLPENVPLDRELTHYLYGGDEAYRLKQEMVLGVGGFRMLQALGFTVRHYHMNEGHSALLGLELLRRTAYPAEELRPGESRYDLRRARDLCDFTTHTPVEAGHDHFSYEMVQQVVGDFFELPTLKTLGGEERLNMTRLALNLSEYINGVAKHHAEVSQRMFPGYRVHAITNGVHTATWVCPSFRALYDTHVPGWCHQPELLSRADRIPDDALWKAHRAAKEALVRRVAEQSGVTFDLEIPIVGFARRMTAYKRPDLLFSDVNRLRRLAEKHPFQIVMAGKAHPRDEGGKRLIEALHAHMRELQGVIPMVFLPDYDMEKSQLMVAGSDLWLNTPLRPLEASGTSGMKAALNGVPQLSTLDGWWIEGCIEGVTGWAVGEAVEASNGQDAERLYAKLEDVVLPLYADRAGWLTVMKGAVSKNGAFFCSHRMMRRYATEAYMR